MEKLCPIWSQTNFLWSKSNWLWNECIMVEEVERMIHAGISAADIYKKDKDKKKRLIRLICKVKNYPLYDETKEALEYIQINADNINLVIKTFRDIKIKINE